MKICLIGVTGHIKYVLNGVRKDKDSRIVGIAPGSPREKIEKIYHLLDDGIRVYSDYREMLDELQPDIVTVACHFNDHARITVEVLERGSHVFVEKPVALTFEELEQVKKAHASSGRYLAAMFGLRYKPWFMTAWKSVRSGMIGDIRMLNAQKSYKLGLRQEFFKHRNTYGGTIPWVGSHAIDWVYWFSGEKFRSVYATHSRKYNKDHGELEVTALCHFTLTNEIFASVSVDYLRPEQAPTHDDDRLRVVGTKGSIEVREHKVFLINGECSGIKEMPLLPEEEMIF